MIETTKGLHLLDKIALPKRIWRLFANIGIILMFAGMIFMTALVVFSDLSLLQSALDGTVMEPNEFTEIQNIFLIPGVNQFIPFVWGLIALIVAVFIHEMMHSVLARVEDVRVHSVGLIVALFPIGGFAKIDDKQLYGDEFEGLDELEDDLNSAGGFNDMTATIEEIRAYERMEQERAAQEQALQEQILLAQQAQSKIEKKDADKTSSEPKAATKTQRSRILAAGVMANFVVALIAAMLFFGPVIGAMAPIGDFQITDAGSSSLSAGLTKEMVLIDINGQKVTDIESINKALENVTPGDSVEVRASYDRVIENYTVKTNASAENINYAGVLVSRINAESPADKAGILANSLIYQIDGEYVTDADSFSKMMAEKNPGEEVVFAVKEYDESGNLTGTREIAVTLGETPDNETKAYIGIYYSGGPIYISLLDLSVGQFNAGGYLEILETLPSMLVSFDFSKPGESFVNLVSAWLFVMMMPFLSILGEGFGGFTGTMMQFFEPVGWAAPLGVGIFWIANLLYWIAWLNFYVGLFNCLPAMPLDGGHLLRTYIVKIAEKLKMEPKKAVRLSLRISTYLTGFIFLSFLIMFIWPYISAFIIGIFH